MNSYEITEGDFDWLTQLTDVETVGKNRAAEELWHDGIELVAWTECDGHDNLFFASELGYDMINMKGAVLDL